MKDEKGLDEKILVVPSNKVDTSYNDINNYTDLPKCTLSKIKHFFEHYKDNEETKWAIVEDFQDNQYAIDLFIKSQETFYKK